MDDRIRSFDLARTQILQGLADHLDEAFPELHFKRKGSKWVSEYHLDGRQDSGRQEDASYCEIQGGTIKGMGNNGAELTINGKTQAVFSPFDVYMGLHNVDFKTAQRELARVCGVDLPNWSEAEQKAYLAEHEARGRAQTAFVKELWSGSAEAQKVLNYLHDRKWSDDDIKAAGIGCATDKTIAALDDRAELNVKQIKEGKVWETGKTHVLAIPIGSRGWIAGFKFRHLLDGRIKPKYLNSNGAKKAGCFFGIGYQQKDLTIVEGELDALHAQAKGAANVVATMGGAASSEQVEDAIKRGATRLTLLFDNDEAGRKYTDATIKIARAAGLSVFVSFLPDGVDDTDEYLGTHSLEEWQRTIDDNALPFYLYETRKATEHYSLIENERGLNNKDREDFLTEIKQILANTAAEDRPQVIKYLKDSEADMQTDYKALLSSAEREYGEQERIKDLMMKTQSSLDWKIRNGDFKGAEDIVKAAAEQAGAASDEAEFAKIFASPSTEEIAAELASIPNGLPTGFGFEDPDYGKYVDHNEEIAEHLTLNSGLTFICGYRAHGKTTFLNNIALNVAERNMTADNGESVLYFSFEIDRPRLIANLLNIQADKKGIDMTERPLAAILRYYRGGAQLLKGDRRNKFTAFQEGFMKGFLESGILKVIETKYKAETLLDAIDWYINHSAGRVSLVCIDYAQLLFSKDYTRQRTEEIKKIVNDMKDYSREHKIPFLMAAQFNREVTSPAAVNTTSIGEGGDIERIADTCVGLFNLKELHTTEKEADNKATIQALSQIAGLRGIDYRDEHTNILKPVKDRIFARLMKRRYGQAPLDTVFEWHAKTGLIVSNDDFGMKPETGDIPLDDEEDLTTW